MLNFIVAAILAVALYIIYQKFDRRNLPPGPIPWPILGSLVEVAMAGGLPFEALYKLSKKYGNIYSLRIGTVPTLVIGGGEEVRAVLKNEDFDNRVQDDWVMDRSYGKPIGLIFSNTTYWKDVRKLTHTILRDFGFGKKSTMEVMIQDEYTDFIQMLKKKVKEDEILLVDGLFNGPMANIIWSLINGTRYDLENKEFNGLLDALNAFMRAGTTGGVSVLSAFPILAKVFPEWTGFAHLHRCSTTLIRYLEKLVQERRDLGEYKTSPSNFIDEFLLEIDNNNDKDSANSIYTDQNLVCVLNDLFMAGSETSANASSFAVRLMVQYPEVQAKIRAEIDLVVGRDRMVTYDDQRLLKFTEATVLEMLRVSHVVGVGPRRAYATCKLGPYEIPAGTTVVINYYHAHMEESVWGDPHNFRPERFLNEKAEICNTEKLVIFGTGKRNCIGEATARASVFIAFTNLIQNFIFEVDPKAGVPSNSCQPGFTTVPDPFTTKVTIRK